MTEFVELLDLLGLSRANPPQPRSIESRILSIFDNSCFERLETTGELPLSEESRGMMLGVLMSTEEQILAEDGRRQSAALMSTTIPHAKAIAATLLKDHHLASTYGTLLFECEALVLNDCIMSASRSKRGPKMRAHADSLILLIAEIYADAGGRTTLGGGPFSRLLKAIWEEFPIELRPALANSGESFLKRAKRLAPKIRERLGT